MGAVIELSCHRRILCSLTPDVVTVKVILRCDDWPALLALCWPHLLQIIKFITLQELQEATIEIVKHSPVVSLANVFLVRSIGQVLHLSDPQWLFPVTSCCVVVNVALTRRSFKFFRHRKAIKGGKWKACFNHSEAWRMGWYRLVVALSSGRAGWYVTASVVQADFSLSFVICKHDSLSVCRPRWMF